MQSNKKILRLQKPMDITPEILKKCARDDRKAIQCLYEHCFKTLMPVCYRYHNNEEDARSSFNLGFIKILKSLQTMTEEFNFGGWSKRIMINTLIDEYRKAKNYTTHVTSKETDRELEFSGSSHSNEGEGNMGYEMIMKLVMDLPEITAKVFQLYVIDGYNHREIGDLLDMSEGTSKWHLSTARKILREKLEEIENTNKRLVV